MNERVELVLQIELKPGEVVVAMTSHRDYVLIVTDRGNIYKYKRAGP